MTTRPRSSSSCTRNGANLDDARSRVAVVGHDAALRAGERDRLVAELVDGHRQQRHRDRARRRSAACRARAAAARGEISRGQRERADRWSCPWPRPRRRPACRRPGRDDARGHAADPLGVGDRGAAVLLDDDLHGPTPEHGTPPGARAPMQSSWRAPAPAGGLAQRPATLATVGASQSRARRPGSGGSDGLRTDQPKRWRPLDARRPAQQDAPYNLADDNDLDTLRDEFDVIPVGDPARPAERQRLAAAYGKRLDAALAAHDDAAAYEHLRALLSLWAPEELADQQALATDLAPFADAIALVRERASRSGADVEAATDHVCDGRSSIRAARAAHGRARGHVRVRRRPGGRALRRGLAARAP